MKVLAFTKDGIPIFGLPKEEYPKEFDFIKALYPQDWSRAKDWFKEGLNKR